MSNTRQQIIETTCSLIERQGYHATGLKEIVEESGAPKGSLYYYFPEGKEQISAEAIEWAGQRMAERARENLNGREPAAQAVPAFIQQVAHHVETSQFCAGGPLQTIALETATTSERLNRACQDAYSLLQNTFREKLTDSGYTAEQANELAVFITAAIEGATILSRTFHSGEPLRQAARQIEILLNANSPS